MKFQPISRTNPRSCLLWTGLAIFIFAPSAHSQQPPQQEVQAERQTDSLSTSNPAATDPKGDPAPRTETATQPKNDRILGVVPNYLTVEKREAYQPLSVGGKFKITAEGAFDYFEFALVAGLAGYDQATKEDPTWRQGLGGYARRYGARFGDQLSGNLFVGAVYPTLLREDPRYFRKGEGSVGHRALYALSRIVVTKKDSGSEGFNYSEILGNATAAGLSNLYHPADERSASETIGTWVLQLGIDAAGDEMKEFWPDLKRTLRGKHHPSGLQ